MLIQANIIYICLDLRNVVLYYLDLNHGVFICPNLRHAYFFFCLHLRHDGWICLWACCIYLSSFNPNCLDLKHIVFICLDLNIALFNSIHVVCNFPDLSRMIFDGVDLSHVICICLDLKNVCLWC